jgi:tetratricopeptide (TPR) repeat protein
MPRRQITRFYTRSDPASPFPRGPGAADPRHNRLMPFWRPLIDMADGELVPLRLRMIAPISQWLAEPEPERWPWFAMIAVPGLRHQVLRHAGLDDYDCREPAGLREQCRNDRWNTLLAAIERFDRLGYPDRALVVFQLLQLTYGEFALRLAGAVRPTGDAGHDRYVFEVARAYARQPGQTATALKIFTELSRSAGFPLLALASCYQGVAHSLRGDGVEIAHAFEERARSLPPLPDDWRSWLIRSRMHRALAMLRLREGRSAQARRELVTALGCNERLSASVPAGADTLAAWESTRQLLQFQIENADRLGDIDVRPLCAELAALDPYCVEARLTIGDAHAAIADYAEAARWYSRAGELGTGAGAAGWFRAAQCYEFSGDRGAALNAMGRCLELDAAALEAQRFLTRRPS